MLDVKELLDNIPMPAAGMYLKKFGLFYWGKSCNGDIVYGVESKNNKLISLSQSTKYLKVFLNTVFDVTFDEKTEKRNLSLIMLKYCGIEFLEIFIRLTTTIDSELSDQELLNYFLNLKNLFSNDSKKSIKELQGLYGELFSMTYLKKRFGIDISRFYQSEDKRKFDFSVSDTKKIEIKTTTLPTRIHRFKLEQLNVLRYDIVVFSIMLQKDDCGMSLADLIIETKQLFSNNLKLMLHIESMIKNIDDEILDTIRYNRQFVEGNIKLFKAIDIPRIQEKTADGVFNVEFDSDLSTTVDLNINSFGEWSGCF